MILLCVLFIVFTYRVSELRMKCVSDVTGSYIWQRRGSTDDL